MASALWFTCSDTARQSGAKGGPKANMPLRSVTQETELSPNLSYTQLLNAQQNGHQQIVVEQKPGGQPQHFIVQSSVPTQSLYYIQGPDNTLIPLQQQQQQYVIYNPATNEQMLANQQNLTQQHIKYA